MSGKHKLICNTISLKKEWYHEINITSQPLLIDANGDYIADIFGVHNGTNTNTTSRCIWKYFDDRSKAPELNCLKTKKENNLRSPHSNSFVDLNGDGNADIIVTAKSHFELWKNQGKQEDSSFVHFKDIKLPGKCSEEGSNCQLGQFAFADFDLDGKLDVLFPLCFDGPTCTNSTIWFAKVKDMWESEESTNSVFKQMTVDLRVQRFDFDDDPLYGALYPRVGDINLDGYPDLLLRMQNPIDLRKQTHLLLNYAVDQEHEIIKSNLKRGFQLQDEIMNGITDTVMATFFDLYENGNEDIILVQKFKNNDTYRIGAFTNNTQDSDAYFVKVIVLSGKCHDDCHNKNNENANYIKVPYGTNTPGQTICYRTQRPGLEQGFGEIESCAPQLTQTAHNALQLPYTIFGLGLAPNFLDYMFVNVTNATDSSRSHTWSQVSHTVVFVKPPSFLPCPHEKIRHFYNIKNYGLTTRSISH